MKVSINQVLQAVINHPYPITTNVLDLDDAPVAKFILDNQPVAYKPLPIKTIDIRQFASEALKYYNKEYQDLLEKHNELLREFNDYKAGNEEYKKFIEFKSKAR